MKRVVREFVGLALACGLVWLLTSRVDLFEQLHTATREWESINVDELVLACLLFFIGSLWIVDRHRRRKLESELRERAAILETGRDCIFLKDDQSRLTQVNPAMERLMGRSRKEMIGRSGADLFGESTGARISKIDRRVLAGETVEAEIRVPVAGDLRTMHVVKSPVRDRRGRIIGTCGVARDVTSLKTTERELLESEQRFQLFSQLLPLILYQTDARGDITFVNDYWTKTTGRSVESLYEEGWPKSVHPEDRERSYANWRRAVEAKADYRDEYRMLRPDGSVVWVLSTAIPVHEEDGEVAGFIGSCTDITKLKSAQVRLIESEERFTQLADNIDEAFWLSDCATNECLYISAGYERIWGRPVQEMYDEPRSWAKYVHPDDRGRAVAGAQQSLTAGNYECEYRVIRPNGEVRWVHDIAFPIRDENGRLYRIAGLCSDITDRRRSEEKLQDQNRIERLLRSELNHRIGNNLSALLRVISIGREKAQNVESFAVSMRGRVEAMAQVHKLLSGSRWTSLNLREMINLLTPPDHAGSIEVRGPDVRIPPRQATPLGMVLHELMVNSTKYGALGQVKGSLAVTWRQVVDSDSPEEQRVLEIHWREICVEELDNECRNPAPSVGTDLVRGLSKSELRGRCELSYDAQGADHRIFVTLDDNSESAEAKSLVGSAPVLSN